MPTGPADTDDPTERRSSGVSPGAPAAAAMAGQPTVAATVPLPQRPLRARDGSADRIEEYELLGEDGAPVTVRHNIDAGTTEVLR